MIRGHHRWRLTILQIFPFPLTIPSILRHWGCIPGSSSSHCVSLGEMGCWKNQWCSGEPGSLVRCNWVQVRSWWCRLFIQTLLLRLSQLHHDVEESHCDDRCGLLYQILNNEVFKGIKFYADQHKPFEVIFGAREWVRLMGSIAAMLARANPTLT